MAFAYNIVEFLNETKDSDILELASLLSDNSELVKSDNNKLVVMRYDVEKYITPFVEGDWVLRMHLP